MQRWLSGGLGMLILAGPAQAQEQAPYVISRLSSSITFDGLSDEAAWEAIPPLPMTVFQPTYQGKATERTELRVAHDDAYLYLSGRLYDSDPSNVRANSLYRDRYSGDDGIALVLDTFNDNENALWFITTPAGVRMDWAVSNDGQSQTGFGGAVNQSWNTFWDVMTVQNEEGWFAEVRIPFSSLGFQAVDGRVEMGLITYRFIVRKAERHIYPAIPPNWDLAFAKPSKAQTVVLEGVHSRKPLYVTPYVLGGLDRVSELNATETAFRHADDRTNEAGLDVKYNLTNNLTLDATLNTDFAQAEADDQQVNLSRVSLFFPEKRQFFQERASIFDFATGRVDRLFYSRRIGLNQDGLPVRILGGTRLVGRVHRWDLGLINMQTAREHGLPSENFGVARLRRQVVNAYSYAGGILTSRINEDGTYNIAYGLDASLRVVGDEYLIIRWAQTFDSDLIDADAYNALSAGLFRVRWERRREQGLNYQTTVKWYGSDFVPGLGFIQRQDILALASVFSYGWFAPETSPVRTISPTFEPIFILRNKDRSLESVFLRQGLSFEMKSSARLDLQARATFEDLLEPLAFPEGTEVPEGGYWFYNVEGNYMASRGALMRTNGSVSLGTFYDGWRLGMGVGPTWNVSRHLELSANYEVNRVTFPDRDQQFTAHILRTRVQAALNKKVSTNAFVQYSSAGDVVTANVRFRYNFREGNDLWIVYNEGRNTDRYRTTPTLPSMDSRALLIKYTYTFGL